MATHTPGTTGEVRKRPYVIVFIILGAVTFVELAITTPGYFPVLENTIRVGLLVLLSTGKASLVVAYYMHLRYEPRWVALIPLGGLALVAVLVAALLSTATHT